MTGDRLARVDASLATQLQLSMELNARMKERLRRLQDHCSIDVSRAVADILVDQEPAWHRG
jgi:hypothetical protein